MLTILYRKLGFLRLLGMIWMLCIPSLFSNSDFLSFKETRALSSAPDVIYTAPNAQVA